ncbi:hypothetical protein LSCM1_01876 [Leishmania martiniquensis]|uniref:Formyl transferase N-terminal domain-containing protein n=1 Tax=Leishmania martiniquensis TaxID=1580590 RepID=A0A836KH84_9TRYP|nr:hypothetical protein LSCM1_01876 [Leishmania martiniquensis]
MPALACRAATLGGATLALQTVRGCRSGRGAYFRMRRTAVAAPRGRKLRTYTAIPLSQSGTSGQARVSTQNSTADARRNSVLIEAMRATHPALSSSAPFRTTSMFSPLVASLAEQLRVSQVFRPASQPACVRVPRLLVFGGDVVSVTALEALHTRMRCIVASALRSSKARSRGGGTGGGYWPPSTATASLQRWSAEADAAEDEEAMADVDAFVRDHITVVCPALPRGMTPEEAAKKFTRQYPVARYCIEHGLPIIPVDDPKSLSRSTLLKEMLSSARGTAASTTGSHTGNHHGIASLLSHRPAHAVLSAAPRYEAGATSPAERDPLKRKGIPPSPAIFETPHTWAAQGHPLADYDLTVVVSFRYYLPLRLLRVLPPVINMHPSLLPRYRGASPIFSALRRNETLGGVSIIQVRPEKAEMDSGNVLWQCEVPISLDMDIRLYFPLVTQIGAAGLCDLIFGEAPPAWRSSVTMPTAPAPALPLSSAWLSRSICHGGSCSTPQAHLDGADCDTTGTAPSSCATVPSWLALRQCCLASILRRTGQRVTVSDSATSSVTHTPAPKRFNVVEQPFLSDVPAPQKQYPVERIGHAPHALDDMAQRHRIGSSEEASSRGDAEVHHHRCPQPWMTLCRASTHITSEVVHAASTALRALFFQNKESPSAAVGRTPTGKKTVSPTAAAEMGIATTMKCADVFPASVLSPHCDWPDSFTYSWRFAQAQTYPTYTHFSEDPHHAPLLSKDAAVVRFSSMNAAEAFGVWRAFVGGDYFQPSVNATLDKSSTPVRNQLVRRALRRLLLQRGKACVKGQGAAPHLRGCAGSRLVDESTVTIISTSEDSGEPVGIVSGKHIDLDISKSAGLQLLEEAESALRIPCTFTHAVNPILAPGCVLEELAEMERSGQLPTGSSTCILQHAQQQPRRRVRFYRAPQAIFRSLLYSRATDHSAQEPALRGRRQPRPATGERGMPATGGVHSFLLRPQCEVDGESEDPALLTKSACTAASAAAEKGRRQTGHHHPAAGGALTGAKTEDEGEGEEAAMDYVPDVIHAAPPTQHHVHIPSGTGYFPESDESFGAIKCKEGWFLWKEAHMKWANKAQPAVLIRKGLAMKTGVLYVGLFSEYS